MDRMRILVVDASAAVRRLLTLVLSSDSTLEVVGSAPNGSIALAKVPELGPELITLNLEMPDGRGSTIFAALRQAYPQVPVIPFSGRTEQVIRSELIPRLKEYRATEKIPTVATQRLKRPAARPDVLVIGVSTGGPNALVTLLKGFPADFPIPVLIVQHMPPLFTNLLAERLNKTCPIRVSEGTANEVIGPGRVWIAPGDRHMSLKKAGGQVQIDITAEPPENSCRPSVDVLFRSAAEIYGCHILAAIMTGMGHDGLLGCARIHAMGGQIFVQDAASSVVWGMPRYVASAGLADKVLPLDRLGIEIVRSVCEHRSHCAEPATVQSHMKRELT
jgi:two-component system, chemotaxis family, protein-glutamate methylesterase/glutaminase